MEKEDKYIIACVSLILISVFILLLNPFTIVNAGEKGVVLSWGAVSDKVFDEGLHLIIPIQQSVVKMNAKTVKYVSQVKAYSSDTQTVDIQVALNYHLQGDKVNKIYQEIGNTKSIEDTIINPSIQETTKAVIAKSTAQQLLEKRGILIDEIKSGLVERLAKSNIIFDDVSLVNFSFGEQYEKAVELKQVAQQQALKAENDLKRIQMEAEQRVTTATAEAEAIQIQAEAITQQGGKDYVSLKAIEKWDGALPRQMVPNGSVPFIDLPNE